MKERSVTAAMAIIVNLVFMILCFGFLLSYSLIAPAELGPTCGLTSSLVQEVIDKDETRANKKT